MTIFKSNIDLLCPICYKQSNAEEIYKFSGSLKKNTRHKRKHPHHIKISCNPCNAFFLIYKNYISLTISYPLYLIFIINQNKPSYLRINHNTITSFFPINLLNLKPTFNRIISLLPFI